MLKFLLNLPNSCSHPIVNIYLINEVNAAKDLKTLAYFCNSSLYINESNDGII